MAYELASKRLIKVFDTLHPEAQHALLEEHLAPLLDLVPSQAATNVLAAAARLHVRYTAVPNLDLAAKKLELTGLLDALERDTKCAVTRERSARDEIIASAVDSILAWLNPIWSAVYEHRARYADAHACLLYACDALERISSADGGCRCAFMNMHVGGEIRSRSGTIVKSYELIGAHNIPSLLLWIWRELFVALSTSGTQRQRALIPDMLADIAKAMGWDALDHLLIGGRKPLTDDEEEEDEDDEIEDDYTDCDDEYEDCDDEESDEGSDCHCQLHARHWTVLENMQRLHLRDLVEAHLTDIFAVTPSLPLYRSILASSADSSVTREILLSKLTAVAGSTADTLGAALAIYATEASAEPLDALITAHGHILRPRDAPALQAAAWVLASTPAYAARGRALIERELVATARAVHAAVRGGAFSRIDSPAAATVLTQVLAQRTGSPARRERVTHWVDAAASPGASTPHPLAFAAMMMGLPPGLADTDPADPGALLDGDEDAVQADVRDELRPALGARFRGWESVALGVRSGPALMLAVHARIVREQPYLAAPDAVDALVGRLQDTPRWHHVCDALEALSVFAKTQRRKDALRAERRRRAEPRARPAAPAAAAAAAASTTVRGLDDVD